MAGIGLSFDAVIYGPTNVCGTGTFVFTGASGATVVVLSETAIRFFSALGFSTGESSLLFLVGFIVIVKGLYASVACDLHNI